MPPPIDDGAQLRKMQTDSGVSVQRFSELMGKSKNTPNNWFNSLTLPDATILAAAKALRMDAGEYFPRLKGKSSQPLPNSSPAELGNITQEALAPYGTQIPSLLPDCQRQLAATQQKLIETLEKYNNLLVEHNQVLRSMARSVTGGGAGGGVAHSLHNAYVNP